MQKPVPSLPAVGKISEVFGCIKPIIIVLLPTWFLKLWVLQEQGPPQQSRGSDVTDEKAERCF